MLWKYITWIFLSICIDILELFIFFFLKNEWIKLRWNSSKLLCETSNNNFTIANKDWKSSNKLNKMMTIYNIWHLSYTWSEWHETTDKNVQGRHGSTIGFSSFLLLFGLWGWLWCCFLGFYLLFFIFLLILDFSILEIVVKQLDVMQASYVCIMHYIVNDWIKFYQIWTIFLY